MSHATFEYTYSKNYSLFINNSNVIEHPVFYLATLTLEPSLLLRPKISLDMIKYPMRMRNCPLMIAHYINRFINKMTWKLRGPFRWDSRMWGHSEAKCFSGTPEITACRALSSDA